MFNDCVIAVFERANTCKELNVPFYDSHDTSNPWTAENGAHIVSNIRGKAAAYINVFNGRRLKKHTCKYVAIHDSSGNIISCGELVPMDKEKDFCHNYEN